MGFANSTDLRTLESEMNKLYNNTKQKRQFGYRKKQGWKSIRQKVIKRDKGQCQGCGKQTARAQVHHIKPRNQGGTNDLSNLITLCGKCHMVISPVPPFALKRAFGIQKSDIPTERQSVYKGIYQFRKRQQNRRQGRVQRNQPTG